MWSLLIEFLLVIQASRDDTFVGSQEEQTALYVFIYTQSQTLCSVVLNKEVEIAFMCSRWNMSCMSSPYSTTSKYCIGKQKWLLHYGKSSIFKYLVYKIWVNKV